MTLLELQNMRCIVRLMFERGDRKFDVWSLLYFKDNTFFAHYNRSTLAEFNHEFADVVHKIAPEYNCRHVTTLERNPEIYVYEDIPKMSEFGLTR